MRQATRILLTFLLSWAALSLALAGYLTYTSWFSFYKCLPIVSILCFMSLLVYHGSRLGAWLCSKRLYSRAYEETVEYSTSANAKYGGSYHHGYIHILKDKLAFAPVGSATNMYCGLILPYQDIVSIQLSKVPNRFYVSTSANEELVFSCRDKAELLPILATKMEQAETLQPTTL